MSSEEQHQMKLPEGVAIVPWDRNEFGMPIYEIHSVTTQVLKEIIHIPGHYTVKVDPLSSKRILHEHGFYYCDTLVEPHCLQDHFVFHYDKAANVTTDYLLDELIAMCDGAFLYGRFHRDFNLTQQHANLRYINWLRELDSEGCVFGLLYNGKAAGFIAFSSNRLVLHAVGEEYRGKGLAKYLWTTACKKMFELGHNELVSSVSMGNLPVVNLYISLGFRLRNAVDVYHKIVERK